LAATVPLEKDTDVAPAGGAKVGAPHPEVEKIAGVATTICPPDSVGRLSMKLAPPTVAAVGLVSVKVSVDVPPATVDAGVKALVSPMAVGSGILTIQAVVEKLAL
jgi:hypothetical protein